MGPDRDLIHPDESIRTNGMDYVRHCIDAAKTLGATNVVGPLYSAVGRTWQQTADERKRDLDLLVRQLRSWRHTRRSRRHDLRRAAQPVRDELPEPCVTGHRGRRPRRSQGLRHPARHVPHEHRGTLDWRRDPRRRAKDAPPPHLRERSRRTRIRTRAVGGSREGLPRHRLPGADGHRVVHEQGEVDRPRRRDLALVRRHRRMRLRPRA